MFEFIVHLIVVCPFDTGMAAAFGRGSKYPLARARYGECTPSIPLVAAGTCIGWRNRTEVPRIARHPETIARSMCAAQSS
jgi:hypothetical protein